MEDSNDELASITNEDKSCKSGSHGCHKIVKKKKRQNDVEG